MLLVHHLLNCSDIISQLDFPLFVYLTVKGFGQKDTAFMFDKTWPEEFCESYNNFNVSSSKKIIPKREIIAVGFFLLLEIA